MPYSAAKDPQHAAISLACYLMQKPYGYNFLTHLFSNKNEDAITRLKDAYECWRQELRDCIKSFLQNGKVAVQREILRSDTIKILRLKLDGIRNVGQWIIKT